MVNTFLDERLKFNKKRHTYIVNKTTLTSVTTFVSWFFKPFDKREVAKKLATFPINKSQGRGYRYWINKWKTSQEDGTKVHNEIDSLIYSGMPVSLLKSKSAEKFIKTDNLMTKDKALIAELQVFSEKYKIAGTIDAMYFNEDRTITLIDWKTSEKIEQKAYKNATGIRSATQEVPDSNYWHYALQLNLYKRILETEYGLKVKNMFIVKLNDDSYEKLVMPDMADVVDKMLEEYKNE